MCACAHAQAQLDLEMKNIKSFKVNILYLSEVRIKTGSYLEIRFFSHYTVEKVDDRNAPIESTLLFKSVPLQPDFVASLIKWWNLSQDLNLGLALSLTGPMDCAEVKACSPQPWS